ncbi:MAG: hypothetical protein GXO62_07310 [Epsilonproteobacteria bacterium]|nr:hypothetical protein [Campylobacterota bacterium]
MRFLENAKLALLIILLTTINYAKDVFISFSFANKNYKLIYQKFNCSLALAPKTAKKRYLFSVFCDGDLIKCCYKHQDEIITKILTYGIASFSNEKLTQNSFKSYAKITFTPKRFDIIIKDGVMKFYLKDE